MTMLLDDGSSKYRPASAPRPCCSTELIVESLRRPSKRSTLNRMSSRSLRSSLLIATLLTPPAQAQSLRIALAKQPFSPTGVSVGPTTMANGGIQELLKKMGRSGRLSESKLTAVQDTEYGAWKKLGWALGDFARNVTQNERDGYFTVGLYA